MTDTTGLEHELAAITSARDNTKPKREAGLRLIALQREIKVLHLLYKKAILRLTKQRVSPGVGKHIPLHHKVRPRVKG